MSASKPNPNITNLFMSNPNNDFLAAIKSANELTVSIEGISFGPISLKGSTETLFSLSNCVKAIAQGAFEPAKTEEISFSSMMTWTREDYGKTFSVAGWALTIDGQENLDGSSTVYLTAKNSDSSSTIAKLPTIQSGYGAIGVFPLSGGNNSIIFTSFSGGAHCCTSGYIITENGEKIDLPPTDGDIGFQPVDIDKDGIFEILTYDDRFLYSFGVYAESLQPQIILSLYGSSLKDASKEPRFRQHMLDSLVDNLNYAFYSENSDISPGFAAGVLAEAARLGIYDIVASRFVHAISNLPDAGDFRCGPPECEKEISFSSFWNALEYRLENWGYSKKSTFSKETRKFYSLLATFRKGFSYDGSIEGCSDNPSIFKLNEIENFVEFNFSETSCQLANTVVFGKSALSAGLCDAEGYITWLNFHFEYADDELYYSFWEKNPIELFDHTGTKNRTPYLGCN